MKILTLSHNKINDINVLELVPFKDLETLHLNKNRITDITVFNRIDFSKMKHLYLSENFYNNNIIETLKKRISDFL